MIDRIGKQKPYRLFIREWMAEKNKDAKQIADVLDRSEGTVSKLLNGKMIMTTEYLAEFAYAIGVEHVDDLFRDPNRPTQSELLRNATPDELRQAVQLIQSVRKGTGTGG